MQAGKDDSTGRMREVLGEAGLSSRAHGDRICLRRITSKETSKAFGFRDQGSGISGLGLRVSPVIFFTCSCTTVHQLLHRLNPLPPSCQVAIRQKLPHL